MNIRGFKRLIKKIMSDGYEENHLFLVDEDGDYYGINGVYVDDEDDTYLSICDPDESQQLQVFVVNGKVCSNWEDDEFVYALDDDSGNAFDITDSWYEDEDGDVCIDIEYMSNDDDDEDCDDYDDDDEGYGDDDEDYDDDEEDDEEY